MPFLTFLFIGRRVKGIEIEITVFSRMQALGWIIIQEDNVKI